MIRTRTATTSPLAERDTGRPDRSGAEWLGRKVGSKRRLWERLNPLSRKQIHVITEALALSKLARLSTALRELDHLVTRLRGLPAEVARQTPPGA